MAGIPIQTNKHFYHQIVKPQNAEWLLTTLLAHFFDLRASISAIGYPVALFF